VWPTASHTRTPEGTEIIGPITLCGRPEPDKVLPFGHSLRELYNKFLLIKRAGAGSSEDSVRRSGPRFAPTAGGEEMGRVALHQSDHD
jgi:hypothetical protein